VSLGGALLLLTMAIAFVPSKVSWRTRIVIGILHVFAHLTAALILMMVLELGVEVFVRDELLATSGGFSYFHPIFTFKIRIFSCLLYGWEADVRI
jgi:hypothetical protein